MTTHRQLANAIRALSMDAIQKANSGHPGAPLGMADMAEALFNGFFRHNPEDPSWYNRDRFVLSNGHASMLLYAVLHLTGYDVSIEDIKNFRQMHSKTPGHPEYGMTPGVETTTGPLGQGIATAVGMALAERVLAAQFNRPGYDIVDHYTYAFMGDGCMMEGLSHEACSLAGSYGLGKLIALYDDNGISIEGNVETWFADKTARRFEAYGWHVVRDVDGHDGDDVRAALEEARAVQRRPSLICCRTQIGFGSPDHAGSAKCHGSPLGEDGCCNAREFMCWDEEPFMVPDAVRQGWDAQKRGAKSQAEWTALFDAYRKEYPAEAAEFQRRMTHQLPDGFDAVAGEAVQNAVNRKDSLATRKASQASLYDFKQRMPELFGGSADLSGSNGTKTQVSKLAVKDDMAGNYLEYGVREFAMAAMMNGMALHGGFIPYAGTFLVFSDYMRNAIRLAGMMRLRVVHVLTHDSIGVGEDGPTHQPVEHVASLRLIPNSETWRPADNTETAVAWKCALTNEDKPSMLILSRQGLPQMDRTPEQIAAIERGGYVLKDCEGQTDVILLGTGSELGLCMDAADALTGKGVKVRVVSMPCTERFDRQDAAYRDQVLPPAVRARVAVEAGCSPFWRAYVGLDGAVVGMDRFGESAPGKELFEFFGFTKENVVKAAESVLQKNG